MSMQVYVQRIKNCNYNYVLHSVSFIHPLLPHTSFVILKTQKYICTPTKTNPQYIDIVDALNHCAQHQQWFPSSFSTQILTFTEGEFSPSM